MIFSGQVLGGSFKPHCSMVPVDVAPVPVDAQRAAVDTPGPSTGFIEEVSGVFHSVRTAITAFLALVSMEARRAALSLVWMAICGLVAGVCIVAAWLGLMAALAVWAVSLGAPILSTVIVVALANAIAGLVLIYLCIGLSSHLTFPATLRQVTEEVDANTSPQNNANTKLG